MGLVTHAGTGSRAPGLTVHSGAIIKQGDAQIQLEVETAESLAIAITIQPLEFIPSFHISFSIL